MGREAGLDALENYIYIYIYIYIYLPLPETEPLFLGHAARHQGTNGLH